MENIKSLLLTKKLLFLLFFVSCSYANQAEFLDKLGVKSGYMIFRDGTELISDVVTSADDSEYSHVGMLYNDQGLWRVVHATPSEKKNQKDGVVVDDFEFFIDKNRSKKYAIYEVIANENEYEKSVKNTLSQIGREFHYDEKKGIYCTLLLYRAWQTAGVELDVKFKKVDFLILKGEYVFLKGFMSSPRLKLVYKSD
ncbi:MAG: hypothetical protein LBG67_04425 [Campylobacteraceae bacterium]|jgi:hypothetical protein|nr:hypothetical protein [Campylobacteraceae bacterium]